MAHLIDKDALVEKIWQKRMEHFNFGGSPASEYCHEDDEILSIINTLEVKEVDLDLEIDLVEEEYYGLESLSRVDVIEIIKHFFELGIKAQKGE